MMHDRTTDRYFGYWFHNFDSMKLYKALRRILSWIYLLTSMHASRHHKLKQDLTEKIIFLPSASHFLCLVNHCMCCVCGLAWWISCSHHDLNAIHGTIMVRIGKEDSDTPLTVDQFASRCLNEAQRPSSSCESSIYHRAWTSPFGVHSQIFNLSKFRGEIWIRYTEHYNSHFMNISVPLHKFFNVLDFS